MVTIGIDPHEASHTAAVVDGRSHVLAQLRVRANKGTLKRLLAWAVTWPERTWAIEGANGLGRLLAQQLVAAGERVVDVPAQLAARARLLNTGHGRKTDGIDAASVAVAALHRSGLRRVGTEDHTAVLRLLSDRRDELAQERRRSVSRGTGSCGTCWPAVRPATSTPTGPPPCCAGCAPPRSSTPSARRWRGSWSPTSAASTGPWPRTAGAAPRRWRRAGPR